MKVCWLSFVASPYKISLFNEIGKEIELVCLIVDSKKEKRDANWYTYNSDSFRLVIVKSLSDIVREVSDCDIFVDSIYASFYGFLAVSVAKYHGAVTVLQADGGIARDRGWLVNMMMRLFMNRHDHILSTGAETDQYFNYYLHGRLPINHYPMTSMSDRQISENRTLINTNKQNNKFILLSIGQPIPRKGFDLLVSAVDKCRHKNEITLEIIGGKPEEKVRLYVDEHRMNNVYFIEHLSYEKLAKHFCNANAFILCTREDIWGLVINEALSFGLPVITSDKCVAGIHFAKILDSVHICPYQNIQEYSDAIDKVFEMNEDAKNNARLKTLSAIKDYSIENCAKILINHFRLIK